MHSEALNLADSQVRGFMELVTPNSARTLAYYTHPVWNRYAAITQNSYGNGTAFYLGCFFDDRGMDQFLSYVKNRIFAGSPQTVFPVICKTGVNSFQKNITYYLNYSSKPQLVSPKARDGLELLTGRTLSNGSPITLEPWGVSIIEHL